MELYALAPVLRKIIVSKIEQSASRSSYKPPAERLLLSFKSLLKTILIERVPRCDLFVESVVIFSYKEVSSEIILQKFNFNGGADSD